MSFINVSTCDDCGDSTYHIELASSDVFYNPDDGFSLVLTEDLAMLLYLELKKALLH